MAHLVPAHMVSVGVSGPTGPFIGCEKKQRFIGCDLEGCQTPRLQLRSSPIDPRCWLATWRFKGQAGCWSAKPGQMSSDKGKGSSDSPSENVQTLAPRPHARFTRMQFSFDTSESRAAPLPCLEPRPRERLQLRVQSAHSTGGSGQGSGSDSEL